MVQPSDIHPHMEVVGSDGDHVGKVDHLMGDEIELSKLDLTAGLKQIPGIQHRAAVFLLEVSQPLQLTPLRRQEVVGAASRDILTEMDVCCQYGGGFHSCIPFW